MALFELYWGSAPGGSVAPLWVVEHLDVIEYIRFGLVAARIDLAAHALAFKKLSATALSWQFPRRLMLETRL